MSQNVIMIRDKWIIGVRNKLSSLAMECDSVAAIEYSKLSEKERVSIQSKLRELVNYIDSKLR
jgi:hypothetical protein